MSATQKSDCTKSQAVLHMALELSEKTWKLGFATGLGQEPRLRDIPARAVAALEREIKAAKERLGLPPETPVVSCYEAGRDGFWLHRCLLTLGVENVVVDSSSIEIDRRQRRAKTDRIDVKKLLKMLIRYRQGEADVWRTVRAPTVEEEDARQLHRELEILHHEQTSHSNRIKGLLASCGETLEVDRNLPKRLKKLRLWDGSALPADLHRRLLREFERMQAVNRQIRDLEKERARRIRREENDPAVAQVRTFWYEERFAHGGKRLRRIGIVAVARKLLVALWRYLENGIPPDGAELTDWRSKLHYTADLA